MEIRRYKPGEEAEIWTLMFNTVRRINARDYTPEQIERWAPADKNMDEWAARLARINPFVAVAEGRILGFAELEDTGHIDCFYCHHEWQGRGVGTALMKVLESQSRQLGLSRLYAEVSATALHFFQARGFAIVEERNHLICGTPARQYLMDKTLTTD